MSSHTEALQLRPQFFLKLGMRVLLLICEVPHMCEDRLTTALYQALAILVTLIKLLLNLLHEPRLPITEELQPIFQLQNGQCQWASARQRLRRALFKSYASKVPISMNEVPSSLLTCDIRAL
jgi:hypothetical protein